MIIAKAPHLVPSAVGTSSLGSTGVSNGRFLAVRNCAVRRVMLVVSTATVSSGNIVVTIKKRPTVGSATGESTITTITIPTAIAAGSVYYKDLSASVSLAPGQEIVADVTTAAAGGGAAGAAFFLPEIEDDPEYVGNQTSMTASA